MFYSRRTQRSGKFHFLQDPRVSGWKCALRWNVVMLESLFFFVQSTSITLRISCQYWLRYKIMPELPLLELKASCLDKRRNQLGYQRNSFVFSLFLVDSFEAFLSGLWKSLKNGTALKLWNERLERHRYGLSHWRGFLQGNDTFNWFSRYRFSIYRSIHIRKAHEWRSSGATHIFFMKMRKRAAVVVKRDAVSTFVNDQRTPH